MDTIGRRGIIAGGLALSVSGRLRAETVQSIVDERVAQLRNQAQSLGLLRLESTGTEAGSGAGSDALSLAQIVDDGLGKSGQGDQAIGLFVEDAGKLLSDLNSLARDPSQTPQLTGPPPSFALVAPEDKRMFQSAETSPAHQGEVRRAARMITSGELVRRYRDVQEATAVPWPVIGALHYREASLTRLRRTSSGAPLRQGCRLPGWRPTPSTAWASLRWRCAGGRGYVLGVNATHQFHSWSAKLSVSGTAEEIAQGLDASEWRRLSAGDGTKGARLHDWAYLELADLEADEFNKALSGTWTRGLLVRRKLADGECAYFTTWCPAGTDAAALAAVEGRRWAIEDSFETAKNELGLDHNETRSWHGWHRHVSFHFMGHLHNGDFLKARTVQVPRNQPNPPAVWPPQPWDAEKAWKISAENALHPFRNVPSWSVERMLYVFEGYNGWGYRDHPGFVTPYLWNYTKFYAGGGYPCDHCWSATYMSKQAGLVSIIKAIADAAPSEAKLTFET